MNSDKRGKKNREYIHVLVYSIALYQDVAKSRTTCNVYNLV